MCDPFAFLLTSDLCPTKTNTNQKEDHLALHRQSYHLPSLPSHHQYDTQWPTVPALHCHTIKKRGGVSEVYPCKRMSIMALVNNILLLTYKRQQLTKVCNKFSFDLNITWITIQESFCNTCITVTFTYVTLSGKKRSILHKSQW